MSTAVANPASEKQIKFIKDLFKQASDGTTALQAAGKDEAVASYAAQVQPLESILVAVLQGQAIEGQDARKAIDTLLSVTKAIKASTPQAPRSNAYAGKCSKCGAQVEAGAGLLTGQRGAWRTEHKDGECVDRAAEAAAEAALEAERDTLAKALFDALGTSVNKLPKANVAVPSATGNNDLDFFKVQTSQRNEVYVLRVIGGHADQRLNLAQAVKALQQITAVDVRAAAVLYGQALEFCGCCGRHLTDEASRAAGIGPDCAKQYGF